MSTMLAALAFERPWALALLAIPLALLVLSARPRSARVVAESDLDTWRAGAQRGDARRPRARSAPLAMLLALAALACAAFAIAGPRADDASRTWIAVLDTSASTSLMDGDATRAARAIEVARALAREHGAALRWVAPAFGARESDDPGALVPAGAAPRATEFGAWDFPGALWVTDAIPAESPRHAGYVASGGAAVPGAVAVDGADRVDWDGSRLVRVAGAAPARAVVAEGVGAETPLGRVITAWAVARAVRSAGARDDARDIVLRVRALEAPTAGAPELVAGRDGWTASGARLGRVDEDALASGALVPWIVEEGATLVAREPGLVAVAWLPGTPSDGAAFAVSWAALFDEAATSPAGVVALDERVAAGPPGTRPPSEPTRGAPDAFAWITAVGAAVLALGALLARRA